MFMASPCAPSLHPSQAREDQGLETIPGGRSHLLLTPRSRSPLCQSKKEQETLARALLSQSVKTPVIVCHETSEHPSQAEGCLAAATARSRSVSPTPNPILAEQLHTVHISNLTEQARPLLPTSASQNTPALTVPSPAPGGRKLPPKSRAVASQCKQCCCTSHHNLADHRLRGGKTPVLACDLADLKLSFREQKVGFKNADRFDSLNQMIWSCDLDLNK